MYILSSGLEKCASPQPVLYTQVLYIGQVFLPWTAISPAGSLGLHWYSGQGDSTPNFMEVSIRLHIHYTLAVLLKDKVRHTEHFELEKNRFRLGSTKLKLARSVPPAGAGGEIFFEKRWKQDKEIIDSL